MAYTWTSALRLAGWRGMRLLGAGLGWIRGKGINALLWLIAALVVVSLLESLAGLNRQPLRLTPEVWDAIVLLTALAVLAWTLRARRRLVVEEFADHSGAAGPEGSAPSRTAGLATLLTLGLTRLADLHHGSGEPSAVSTHAESGGRKGKMVIAGISSDADPDFLRNAVSAESNVTLGPMTIPVGLLVGFLGRLASGPRVIGSLHRDGDVAILSAQVASGGRRYGWKVTRPWGEGGPPMGEMVDELACRIYTDVAMDRTTKWRATRCFGEGLDAYRDTLRTPLDRRLNLRRAERRFLEASAEDQNFDLAYYNLGIVYRELGKPEAAYGAFMRTIELNPSRLEAYYAIAANRWRQGDYRAAVALCDRVLSSAPGALATDAYNLRSLALAYQLDAGDPAWAEVVEGQRVAVRRASRALRRAHLSTSEDRDRAIERGRVELSTCLVTLAFACRNASGSEASRRRALARAECLIVEAVALDASASQVHFSLGDVRLERGRRRAAAEAFRAAARIAPRNFDYWAHLGLALAGAAEPAEARAAIGRALGSPYSASDDALEVAARALAELGDESEGRRVAGMKRFLAELADEVKVVDGAGPAVDRVASMTTFLNDLADQMEQLGHHGMEVGDARERLVATKRALRGRIASEDWSGRAWERSQTEIVLAYLATRDEDWFEAERRLEVAVQGLEQEHPTEIGERGLRAELARVQLNQGRKGDALASAQAAVDLDPLSPKARAALAEVRSCLGEHEAAKEALEVALLRAPEAPEGHVRLGHCMLTLARGTRAPERRDQLLRQATEHARQALDLYPSDQLHETVAAHELLGSLHLELREHHEAIARLEIARALRRRSAPAALVQLAAAYLGNGDYPHAELLCLELIGQAGDGDPTELIDSPGDEASLRGELLAQAHLLQARARIERDVELHRALELVRSAKRSLRAAHDGGIDRARADGIAELEARCWAQEGLVLHKTGKLDEALRRLEHAALLGGHPTVYVHLAQVSAEKVELAIADEVERHTMLARAGAYCRRAAEADVFGEHREEIAEVSERLRALRAHDAGAGERPPAGEEPPEVSARAALAAR